MKLYTDDDFNKSKYEDKLPLKCENCEKIFYITKHRLQSPGKWKDKKYEPYKFCSLKCNGLHNITRITVECKQCEKKFSKTPFQIKKTKNNFCCKSCAAIYNNAHKTKGTRRSKLEIWIEKQLITLYPNIEIQFNKTDMINSELDIYIPSLKLAFELNGIFHYEPIYGEKKFNQTINNDHRKFSACAEKNIDLCIIDTSLEKYFKIEKSKKYLDIITNIIEKKLLDRRGLDLNQRTL